MLSRLKTNAALFLLFFLVLNFNFDEILGCNEAVCGSIVSKCSLLKSCNCTISQPQTTNSIEVTEGETVGDEAAESCSCCGRCKLCLDNLFFECCSCFGLCSKPNVTAGHYESMEFDFDSPSPTLWDALTKEYDERSV